MNTNAPKKSSGLKTFLIILFLVFGGVTFCSYNIYKQFKDFPEWAEEDSVYQRHGDLIAAIEEQITEATGQLDLAARLEKLSTNDQLLYLEIDETKDSDDISSLSKEIVVIGDNTGSKSHFISGHTGHGTLDGQETIVMSLSAENLPTVEKVLFHIKR